MIIIYNYIYTFILYSAVITTKLLIEFSSFNEGRMNSASLQLTEKIQYLTRARAKAA